MTAHPEGCAATVQQQIQYIKDQAPIVKGPRRVLVIGASTGYGLAARIAAAFGSNAATLGVFFERPSMRGKPASPGWYQTVAFEKAAQAAGLYHKSINGDAFSKEVKQMAVEAIKRDLGQVDLVVYSLAAPQRKDPYTDPPGHLYKSCLKTIGTPLTIDTIDTTKRVLHSTTIDAATEEEVEATCKVMGGEDWERWVEALEEADVLSEGAHTVAFSYIGPQRTRAVYRDGTIGRAKDHLEATAKKLDRRFKQHGGRALVSINKAVVTQASSAIPFIPMYISALFRVMKDKGLHEDCIQQLYRLYAENLYSGAPLQLDDQGRIRLDDLEMRGEVQEAVDALLEKVTSENFDTLIHFEGYETAFLNLFGFNVPGTDYNADVEVDHKLEGLIPQTNGQPAEV